MINYIIYFLTMYGLTNLLVFGSGPFDILVKFREKCREILPTLGDMLDCPMCTSANLGWIACLVNIILLPTISLTPFNLLLGGGYNLILLKIFGDLCITSGVIWLIHTLQEALERLNNN